MPDVDVAVQPLTLYPPSAAPPHAAPPPGVPPSGQPAGTRSASPHPMQPRASSDPGSLGPQAAQLSLYTLHPVQPTDARSARDSAIRDDGDLVYFTYKRQVKLKPGQTLAYRPGKGYYAQDVTRRSAPQPPQSPSQRSGLVSPTAIAHPEPAQGGRTSTRGRTTLGVEPPTNPATGVGVRASVGVSVPHSLGSWVSASGGVVHGEISGEARASIGGEGHAKVKVNTKARGQSLSGTVEIDVGGVHIEDSELVAHARTNAQLSVRDQQVIKYVRSGSPHAVNSRPYSIEVSIGSEHQVVKVGDMTLTVGAKVENGQIVIEETTTVTGHVRLPGGGTATVEYSVTISLSGQHFRVDAAIELRLAP